MINFIKFLLWLLLLLLLINIIVIIIIIIIYKYLFSDSINFTNNILHKKKNRKSNEVINFALISFNIKSK